MSKEEFSANAMRQCGEVHEETLQEKAFKKSAASAHYVARCQITTAEI